MNHMPSVRDFGETSALYSVMEGDMDDARRICADMNRWERTEFLDRLRLLQSVIENLNSPHCLHCGERVAKVPPERVKGHVGLNTPTWWHPGTGRGFCSNGKTAEPAPQND